RASQEFAFEVEEAGSLEDAARGAGVVTIVTRAKEPFVPGSIVETGAHVNAVGAILRGYGEFHQDLFDRAGLVAVDNVANVKSISTEFIERYEHGLGDWATVHSLSELVAAGKSRPPDVDVSLFKALGMGIADLALATEIYARAIERRVGREIPSMGKSKARWRSAKAAG